MASYKKQLIDYLKTHDVSEQVISLVESFQPTYIKKEMDTLPFGKYKGQKISAVAHVDRKYCEWMLSKPDFSAFHKEIKKWM